MVKRAQTARSRTSSRPVSTAVAGTVSFSQVKRKIKKEIEERAIEIAEDVAKQTVEEWRALVKQNLRSTREAYLASIKSPKFKVTASSVKFTINFEPSRANIIAKYVEYGMPRFKMNKERRVVRFEHSTRAGTHNSFMRPFERRNIPGQEMIRKDILKSLKSKKGRRSLDVDYRLTSLKAINSRQRTHEFKRGIYGGATHENGKLVTYRTMSPNASGWIHPGLKPKKYVKQMTKFAGALVKEAIKDLYV